MRPTGNPSILLVDDATANLQLLRETLDGCGYKLLVATDGASALAIARKALPDLVLLDIMLPDTDGYEVCRRLKADEATRSIPVIFLTALADAADEARGLDLGAVDYISKPITPELVRARVRNHLELKHYRDHLEQRVKARTLELQLTQAVMIDSLATLAEYRDPETGGHVKRTQSFVKALAVHLKSHPRFRSELTDETIALLYLSAPLHDVGKVAVRDHILLKPGRLDEGEFEEMKKHTLYGEQALRISEEKLGKSTFLRLAREIAATHQEKWDGSGYPRGLKGDEIPIPGRLMALADVYDALVSKRVYKPPIPHEEAVQIIRREKGRHFDPDVVEAFLELQGTFRNIALTYADFAEERELLGAGREEAEDGWKHIRRVLLAEDNAIILEIMRNQLTAMGFTVDTAVNGVEALSLFRERPYDLILTDMNMPGMGGERLVAEVRRMEAPGRRPLPILAVTASELDLTEEAALSAGFNGFMLKPLDPEVFKKKVNAILSRGMVGPKTEQL
jgi:putative two-component system response regulator